MIKAVFFDIDNTLLSFDASLCAAMKYGFDKFGLRKYESFMIDIFHKTNNQLWHEIEEGILSFDELMKIRWNRIFKELDIDFDGCKFEKFFRDFLFDSAIPVNGANEILEYLSEKYILCCASNGPYEQQVNRLKTAGMLPYFSHLFISEKIGFSKPSAEFFSCCLKELNQSENKTNISPEEIMIIGDSLSSDIAGGINYGLKTCYFDINATKNTKEMKIDYTIENLNEIRSFL